MSKEETTYPPLDNPIETSVTLKFRDGILASIDHTGETSDLAIVLACQQISHALLCKPLQSQITGLAQAITTPKEEKHENQDT